MVELSEVNRKAFHSSSSGVRKSLRARAAGLKQKAYGSNNLKLSTNKSRSRRHVLKRQPTKLGPAAPPFRLEQNVRHGDTRFVIGDIVSVIDVDGGVYYAQIRSLTVDAVGESGCVLTWLIPTTEFGGGNFRPEHFVLGMEEDVLRCISCCRLVCRCPADYFQPIDSPYAIKSYS